MPLPISPEDKRIRREVKLTEKKFTQPRVIECYYNSLSQELLPINDGGLEDLGYPQHQRVLLNQLVPNRFFTNHIENVDMVLSGAKRRDHSYPVPLIRGDGGESLAFISFHQNSRSDYADYIYEISIRIVDLSIKSVDDLNEIGLEEALKLFSIFDHEVLNEFQRHFDLYLASITDEVLSLRFADGEVSEGIEECLTELFSAFQQYQEVYNLIYANSMREENAALGSVFDSDFISMRNLRHNLESDEYLYEVRDEVEENTVVRNIRILYGGVTDQEKIAYLNNLFSTKSSYSLKLSPLTNYYLVMLFMHRYRGRISIGEERDYINIRLEINSTGSELSEQFYMPPERKVLAQRLFSHETRNRLVYMSNRIQLELGKRKRFGTYSEDAILSAIKDLRAEILLFNTFRRVVEGSYIQMRSPISTASINHRIINTVSQFTEVSEQEFRILSPGEIDTTKIEVDLTLLNIVIRELVLNAVKYSEAGDQELNQIQVTTELSEGDGNVFLEIKITDSGIGISTESLEQITQNTGFAELRGRRALQSRGSGTGDGLNLVKLIVRQEFGGDIIIFSPRAGGEQGTEITVRFPVKLF